MDTFLNIIFLIGIIQGLVFFCYWLFIKKNRLKPIVFLNTFVLFLTLNNVQVLIFINEIFAKNDYLRHVEFSWYLLILPYFLAFIIHYFDFDSKKQTFLKAAWFLFSLQILIRISLILLFSNGKIDESMLINYSKTEEVFNLLVSLFLFYKIYTYIFQEQWSLKLKPYDDIYWLKSFFIASCFVIFFWIFAVFLNLIETSSSKFMYNPLRISSSVLLYWIAYIGMIKMNLTFERKAFIDFKEQIDTDFLAELNITIKDFKKIDAYVNENLRFTDIHFSLDRLAIELKINRSDVSKIINTYDESFSNFINKKRVEEAKRLLSETGSEKFTLDVVAYECGFNSKSNFYLIFKKYVGCTPAEWKKNQ
jgi:AraC-like DNA-binding protein